MQVVGEVQIMETISASPTALWEQTKKFAGISRDKYREYFKGCETAYAYKLGDVTRYEQPKELSEFNIYQPPQSFVYIPGGQPGEVAPDEAPLMSILAVGAESR